MTPPRKPADVPSLALPVEQAAESLGLSQSHFRQHVLPHAQSIKVGRARIVPDLFLVREPRVQVHSQRSSSTTRTIRTDLPDLDRAHVRQHMTAKGVHPHAERRHRLIDA